MKKIKLFFVVICALVGNANSQTVSEYGNWFFIDGNSSREITPKKHSQIMPVLPSTGYTFSTNSHKIKFSQKEKNKCIKIIDLFKTINPKPKYLSMTYDFVGTTPAKLPQAAIDKRDYRFNYCIGLASQFMHFDEGKPVDMFRALTFGIEWDFATININAIPDFLGGHRGYFDNRFEGPLFTAENDFSYKKFNGDRSLPTGGEEREKFPRYPSNDLVVSITNQAASFESAKKEFGDNFGVPNFLFGNDADKHFVYRKFYSSRSGGWKKENDKYNRHEVQNMVILSHNNQLPFKPITIERFLQMADDIVDEIIENYKNKKDLRADIKQENLDKNARTKSFIQNLREKYINRLQEHAIIAESYDHLSDMYSGISFNSRTKQDEIWNSKTDKREPVLEMLSNFFITDTKYGKAFYTYDKEYYKNMADGEIRTIAVVWKDYIRVPDHRDYGKGFQLEEDKVKQNRFSDNPDHYLYHFNKKMDWEKLETLLGK